MILPGSDPLPLAAERDAVGRYGFVLEDEDAADLEHPVVLSDFLQSAVDGGQVERDRFLAEDVLLGFGGRFDERSMSVCGRADENRVDLAIGDDLPRVLEHSSDSELPSAVARSIEIHVGNRRKAASLETLHDMFGV